MRKPDPTAVSTTASAPPWRRAEVAGVAALAALALALRGLWWSRTAIMFADGPRYLAQAGRFASGDFRGGVGSTDHPLYALAIAGLRRLQGVATDPAGLWASPPEWERAAVAVSILCGTLAVVALYAVLRGFHERGTAALAALLLAVHVRAVAWSADVQSDALYALLFLVGAGLLWRALARGSAGAAALAGAAAGLSFLARPEGLGLVVVGGALAAWEGWRGAWAPARVLRFGAGLGLALALVAGPYWIGLRVLHGEWMVTPKKSVSTLAGGAFEPGAGALAPAGAPGSMMPLPDLARLPLRPAPPPSPAPAAAPEAAAPPGRLGTALSELWIAVVAGLRHEIVVFLAIGLAACAGRPGPRGRFVASFALLYGVVLIALSLAYGYISTRHAVPPLLLALGYAAIGLRRVGGWLAIPVVRLAPGLAASRALPVVLGVALALPFAVSKHVRWHRPTKAAERLAAEWLGERADVGVVAVNRPRVAFYAGAPSIDLRRVPDRLQLFPVLRAAGATHLIVDARGRLAHPDLADPAASGLRLLHQVEDAQVFAIGDGVD